MIPTGWTQRVFWASDEPLPLTACTASGNVALRTRSAASTIHQMMWNTQKIEYTRTEYTRNNDILDTEKFNFLD